MVITDDPYEYITYAGKHHPIATCPACGADRHDLEPVQDLQLHRLAPRLRDRSTRDDQCDPQGARFPDRRRARAIAAAAAVGYAFDAEYFNHLARDYRVRRDLMARALTTAGFQFTLPKARTTSWPTSRS